MMNKHNIINIKSLDIQTIHELLIRALFFKNNPQTVTLTNKIIGNLFFEPSTRTHCSFQAAIQRCGGNSIDLQLEYSSMKKGESLEDTVKTMEQYCDLLVIRHPEKDFIERCTDYISIPIINAGNGDGEHPTQALLDLFTIQQSHNLHKSLKIAFCGDLKHSRTCHSLVYLLDKICDHITFYFISDDLLVLDDIFFHQLRNKYICGNDLGEVISSIDVLYMTRLQKERMKYTNIFSPLLLPTLKNISITNDMLNEAKPDMILLHPLPRNEELPRECDSNPRSKYFEQMKNGVYMRMAILEWCLAV